MTRGSLPGVLRFLRQLEYQHGDAPGTDRHLLQRFAAQRDEAAFAALLERHGPMVWSVCLRMLQNAEDAEDAFQATFLVLARRAGEVRWQESIGGWLHTVAQLVARKARATAARAAAALRAPELGEDAVMPDADPALHAARHELRAVVDEEVARLPAKYRAPLVLCYLEGQSNEEAARQLGWTKGTVSGRLSRGRDMLRRRLERRGLALSSAALMAVLPAATASAAVPAALVAGTLRVAVLDGAAASAVSAKAAALATSTLETMIASRHKWVWAVLFVVCLAGVGAAVLAYPLWTTDPPPEQPLARDAGIPPPDAGAGEPKVPVAVDPQPGHLKEPEFIAAEVTLHLGRDGFSGELAQDVTQVVMDPAALARLVGCFPGLAQEPMKSAEPSWLPRLTIKFHRSAGETLTLRSTWQDWSGGAGDHKVQGNLVKHVGELFEVPRLVDQGLFMDPWHVVAFEEGGQRRGVYTGELYVTDATFGLRVSTYGKKGITADSRIEYQSPRYYTVDPNKNPKELNLFQESKVKPAQRGIYAIEGDTLKICLDKSGKKRPLEFRTESGNNDQILLMLKQGPVASK